MYVGRNTEVQVRYPPVDKMEDVSAGPTVKLGFDPLRVCVRGQLLARVLGGQKQCVILRIWDLEFESAH